MWLSAVSGTKLGGMIESILNEMIKINNKLLRHTKKTLLGKFLKSLYAKTIV